MSIIKNIKAFFFGVAVASRKLENYLKAKMQEQRQILDNIKNK